ncbi:fibrinogen-like YCDxxxxGGGW domain-containing protein [Rothia nasimurium]|uniref:fibrinogen-like YCDxxxxGGGW domain-containing protein n=1 Tax=Rothia nasimurium TaxID=85336 RepID=UPI002DD67665|nr:fibrinogen-like YCDxxxxGGGW domain-containing protein [Rothia nasimurium]
MKKPSLITKIAVGAVALGLGVSVIPGAIATDDYVANGLTSETAAASCWEIKQNDPKAESGSYWLWTDQMSAPAQFYCDQETDGGGWVMIGRGRDGWSEDYAGKGDPNELANNPDGTDAFSPVQLPSSTIDALLGETKVQDLEDGVRFYRAGNAEGTVWQNMYAQRTKTEEWSWTLSAYHPWENIRYVNDPALGASRSYPNSVNRISNHNDYYYSNNFYGRSNQSWRIGFAYGRLVQGTDTATSYLWSRPAAGYAIPFTQVYLRPKLTQKDLNLTEIAASGTEASSQRVLPASFSSRVTWRTSLDSGTGATGELNTRVQAINQLGDTVYTGGDFAFVENAVTGEKVNQKFIAGYDVNSGELVRSFTPQLNGQVKAISPLPNGKLAVGGEFTEVNGQPSNGFVILDPVTGATDTSLGWDIVNRTAAGVSFVKSIDVHGDYVYIAGNFTHVKGSTSDVYAYSRNVARFRLSNNSVDWNWRPIVNGTVNGVSASDEGVTIGGYFSTVNNQRAWKLAYLSTSEGAIGQKWEWKLSHRAANPTLRDGFQFDVQDAGDSIWAGGAEHLLAQYSKSDVNRRMTSFITKSGGDFQDLFLDQNGVLFAACHCGDWIYEGAETHDIPWGVAGYRGVNTIRLVAAFDAQTGEILPDFTPGIQGARGHGVWASFVDSNNTLWVGGDITRSLGYNGVQQTVGFARYAARDSQAPATASNLSVTRTAESFDKLTWTGVAERGVTYQILRNNRVIASTQNTSYKLPSTKDARYFVRVADAAGNVSASTAAALAQVETPVVTSEPTLEPTVEPTTETPSQEPSPEAPVESAEATPSESASAEASAEPAEEPTIKPIEEIVDEPEAPAVEEDENPEAPLEEVAQEQPKAADQQVISSGDQWAVAFRLRNAYDTTWRDYDYKYDTAAMWYDSPTPVGWQENGLARRVYFPYSPYPMSFMARKEVNFTPQPGQDLVITTYADDGMALYVNGKEVHRTNLPATAYPDTPALARVLYNTVKDNPITLVVPASELRDGKNVIAVQVHSFRRSEGTTFDLEAVLKSR